MTELCQRCGRNPVATLEPPDFPFCESCWPIVASQGNYSVDEDGNFTGFMTEAEIAERYRQAGEAALAMAEDEGRYTCLPAPAGSVAMTTIGITPSADGGGCLRCGSFKRWGRRHGPLDEPCIDFLCADCDPPVGFVEVFDVRDHSISTEEFEHEIP